MMNRNRDVGFLMLCDTAQSVEAIRRGLGELRLNVSTETVLGRPVVVVSHDGYLGVIADCEGYDLAIARVAQIVDALKPQLVLAVAEYACAGRAGVFQIGSVLGDPTPDGIERARHEPDARSSRAMASSWGQSLRRVHEMFLASGAASSEKSLRHLDSSLEAVSLDLSEIDTAPMSSLEVPSRWGIPWVAVVSAGPLPEDRDLLLAALPTILSVTEAGAKELQAVETPDEVSSEVELLLWKKLRDDFARSLLWGEESLARAAEEAFKNLVAASLDASNDTRIDFPRWRYPRDVWEGVPPEDACRSLSRLGTLRVRCSAIYPAAIATLQEMQSRGLCDLEISVEEANSVDLVSAINRDHDADVIISAEDPFFLVGGMGTFQYRRVIPILRADQKVFRRSGSSEAAAQRVYVAAGSSAATQLMSNPALGGTRREVRMIQAADILSRALSMDVDEQMPVWAPLAHALELEASLEPLDDSRYQIFVSLYAHIGRWYGSVEKERLLQSFVQVFVALWSASARDIPSAAKRACEVDGFRRAFGAGVSGKASQH